MPDNPGPDTGSAASRIVFDGVAYDAINGPDDTSSLVQRIRTATSQQLEIEALARHLIRVDDLLHIAACGLAGRLHPDTRQALGAQVMGLQYRLRGETGALELALASYGEGARNVLGVLRAAMKDLYGLHEDDALIRLGRSEALVTKMADSVEALEGKLRGLIEDTARVVELAAASCTPAGPASFGIEAKRAELDTRLASMLSLRAAIRTARADIDLSARNILGVAVGEELTAALAEPCLDEHANAVSAGTTLAQRTSDEAAVVTSARELRAQEREALQAMAGAALQLAAARDDDEIEAAGVVALLHARFELEQIVAILADQRHTLTRMATDCSRLTELDLRAEIKRLMPMSTAQRIGTYGSRGFLARALWIAAQWQGMQQAAGACQATLHRAYVKMGETYTRNPTVDEARRLVPEFGSALAHTLDTEIRALGE
jgi:hypothetical protein